MSPLTPEAVSRAVATSGKPLEVRTATTFLEHGWSAQLGSYYLDSATDKPRELDVLVEKTELVQGARSGPMDVRFRVLVSVKGFPPGHFPVAYSVESRSGLTAQPMLLSSRAGVGGHGPLPDVSAHLAAYVLTLAPMDQARPVVGLDVLQEQKDPESPPQRKGDRETFDAVDGAVKAALFWNAVDEQGGKSGKRYVSLAVPLVVLGTTSFWDVPLEAGARSGPTERSAAYAAALYPVASIALPRPTALPLLWLLCSMNSLPAVVTALDRLADGLRSKAMEL
jgi:hypothetical protein